MSANSVSIARAPARSMQAVWIGRVLSGLLVIFLLMDGAIHILRPQPVVIAMAHLGYPLATAPGIGIVELICIVLFLVPRTAPIGAVLITGLLGGAMAAHVRVADPIFDTYVFPVLIGVMTWAGLALRNPAVLALMPRSDRGSNEPPARP